ncbi:MAG: hypothetical protein KGD60_01285 [Candidatus Thorarchaeota archaeon]|nr:hypothetical protein [Candidatus Thorarchaeota archaeon]
MWLQILLIPFVIILFLFFIFWIVHEGSRWQKHPTLGFFARFIQASPRRSFITFFSLFLLLIPAALLLMTGMWVDSLDTEIGPQQVDVVIVMLLVFVVLAMSFPVMYSSLGTWRNAKRAEAEMKVKPTGM